MQSYQSIKIRYSNIVLFEPNLFSELLCNVHFFTQLKICTLQVSKWLFLSMCLSLPINQAGTHHFYTTQSQTLKLFPLYIHFNGNNGFIYHSVRGQCGQLSCSCIVLQQKIMLSPLQLTNVISSEFKYLELNCDLMSNGQLMFWGLS